VYDGTLAALIRCYQTDKNSPYRGLRQSTARVYADCAGLSSGRLVAAGSIASVDRLSAMPATPGGAPRVRLAKSCTRSMLSILLNYGAELGLPGCLDLAQVLERMILRVPQPVRRAWKAARPKKTGMTYDQASAIVAEGLRRGTRRHRSVALGVAAQFELTLRQVDVIGYWEKIDAALGVDRRAVVDRGQVWRPGLRFEDFAAGELDLETSKTDFGAVFDVTVYPLFQQALAAVPEIERRGLLVTDDNGAPVRRRYYWDVYRDVADAAGVPRAVWNTHARHGGATEAQQAGVALADIAEHAQHSDINTTRKHYIVPSVETSRQVAQQRVAHRQAKKNTP
jgi:hypothetical protein